MYRLIRVLLLAPFLFVGLAQSAPISEEAIQRRFEEGVALMSSSPKEAVEVFKILY